MKKNVLKYLLTFLKVAFFAPVIVTVHLFRVIHGLYLLLAQCLLGMTEEADRLLDELLSIDL